MPSAAPRLHPRIVEQIDRLARGDQSVADIRRTLVVRSIELSIPPPSYEHVRRLVARRRLELEAASSDALLPVAVDVALGIEHGSEFLRVAGGQPRRRRSRW